MGAITLGAVTIAVSFIILSITSRCGVDVSARFLERGKVIPSMQEALTQKSLSTWLTISPYKRPYALWVIPLDFVFMLSLGAFLATGSLFFAQAIAWPYSLTLWQWLLPLVAPTIYVLSDATEDVLIIRILLGTNLVKSSIYAVKSVATSVKMLSATIALAQTVGLGIWSYWFSNA
jgi:hypothetical protein